MSRVRRTMGRAHGRDATGRMRLSRAKFDQTPGRDQSAPRAFVYAVVVGALLLIFWLDWATESAPVQHLYYVPIILASLRGRRWVGLGAAITAIVLYHLANPRIVTAGYREGDIVQVLLFAAVAIVTAKLADDGRRLQRLAATDDLTGLHNLRSFEAHLDELVRLSGASGKPLSMLVLDVDRLKSINDRHGHLAGAEAVRLVGGVLAARLPPEAVACRYGGDEFAVALPQHTVDQALAVAGDVRLKVSELAPVLAGISFPRGALSISVGVACLDASESWSAANEASAREAGESLFKAADRALYDAKQSGRNRASVSAALVASTSDAQPHQVPAK